LPSGVYVAMNGQVFHWNEVKKNRAIGKFERK
jgi:L-asparaginase